MIYSIDRAYRITSVNDEWNVAAEAHRAPQLQSTNVIGTSLLDWIQGPSRAETQSLCDAIFNGEVHYYEYQLACTTPLGPRRYQISMAPIHDTRSTIVGITFVSHVMAEPTDEAHPPEVGVLLEQLRRQHTALIHTREQAQALGHLLTTLNESLSMRMTIKTLLSMITELVQRPAAAVYLLGEHQQRLVPWASRGVDLEGSDPRAFDLETSLAGRVLADRKPQEIADCSIATDLVFPRLSDGGNPGALYVVPLTTYAGPVGVLEVYSPKPRSLSQGQRDLINILAASAGISITNAQLFDREVQVRREAEEQAQRAAEQAARLHATLGSMTDGVWICNQDGILVSVNDAGLTMFGLQRTDVIGKPLSVLAHLFDIGRGERRRLGLRLALQGEPLHAECDVQLSNRSDSLTVDIRATPVRDEQHQVIGAVAVVRDMTEAKLMDRLKEDFLSIAAHELKTPITALKGYTQLALKRVADIEQTVHTRRMLETINEQADRITGLVQKLLDVSRIHSGRLELQFSHFDLQSLIATVVAQAQLTTPVHTIEVVDHSPTLVTADYLRIEQVFFNLLDNAIKYSPRGGTIRVSTVADHQQAQVTVQDQGVGIPEDKIPHIFDRWYQAHQSSSGDYGGMGLGLFICKEIIEQHGGQIWATPVPGVGASISFRFPVNPMADDDMPSVRKEREQA